MNRVPVLLCLGSLLSLAGCSGISNVVSPERDNSAVQSLKADVLAPLQGYVYRGHQPAVRAHVYLYATGSGSAGGKDVTPTSANASVSLLSSTGSNVSFDGTNYYVTTGADGGFSISGDYTCTPGEQLYLYAVGGNPGSANPSDATFLAGVGACPAGGSGLPANAIYIVNEVTTVATAYALVGFASDPLHISANSGVSGSSMSQLAATGIANAMANVSNLVDPSTGTALAMTPGGNGNVPQAEINTLANILASCINGSGKASSSCATLFNVAKSDGAAGTTPTDTAAAVINIAHNVTQNVSALYALQSPPEPFDGMKSQPNDFSLAISFGGGGASMPRSVAIDASGNVWGVSNAGVVNAYSSLGVPLSPNGLASATTNPLNSLAIDSEGDIWVQDVNGIYTEFGPAGGVLSPSGGYSGGSSGSSGLTTDSFGYFWSANSSNGTIFRFDPIANKAVANYSVVPASLIQADSAGYIWLASTSGTLYKLNQAGSTVATYPSLYSTAAALTVDSANSVYVDDSTSKQVLKLAADGTQSSFPDGVAGGQAFAVDGANNVWSANNSIDEHSSAGANLLTTDLRLAAGTSTTSMAVDGSGDLWVADTTENGQPGTHYTEVLGVAVPTLTPVSYVTTHGTLQNALNLTIGFNGPDVQFPYMDRFYAAQSAYYESIGSSYPAGGRYCHAYLSWDIAEQAVGSGPVGKEGSRSWFEDWLAHAQGHCDRALVTFKYIANVTQNDTGTYPSPSDYEAAMTSFLDTDWSYTGWAGMFDFTPWNEPQNGAGSGDGLTKQIPAENAADYYLALRKHCLPSAGCTVAAGDFGSNGQQWQTYLQNCTDDSAPLCTEASYMDQYKHWIMTDAPNFGFTTAFRPEVFAYHGWDDINNYINSGSHCTDPQRCTVRALVTALSDGTWSNSIIWDTEVAAGQNPQSNPDPVTQACAASYLLDLTASVSSRITRIYWTQPYVAAGNYFSMFDSSGNPKPAFTVMADRNIAYVPPTGSSCP